jgi:hypothetical protein
MSVLTLMLGECVNRMGQLPPGSVDVVLCDPPYDLTAVSRGGSSRQFVDNAYGRTRVGTDRTVAVKGFMGKTWDGTGIAFSTELWDAVFQTLAPGGFAKVFGGTRTFHRMAAAMITAGFLDVHLDAWGYGSGFPKSLNISKAIDRMQGAERGTKKVPYTGNAVLRSGGQNTRPWMEDALKAGFHELPDDTPVTDDAKLWDGWGTALKPAWEPILVGSKAA